MSRRLAPLVAALALAVPAAQAQTLDEARQASIGERSQYNQALSALRAVLTRAGRVSISTPGFDKSLDVPRAPGELDGQLSDATLLQYLPANLIRDVNRRIQREYARGYYAWSQGQWPPVEYANVDDNTRLWATSFFVFHNRDIWAKPNPNRSNWNPDPFVEVIIGTRPPTYTDAQISSSAGGGSPADIAGALQTANARTQAALQAVTHAAGMQAPLASGHARERRFIGTLVWVDGRKEAEWKRLWEARKSGAETAMTQAIQALQTVRTAVVRNTGAYISSSVSYTNDGLRVNGYEPVSAGGGGSSGSGLGNGWGDIGVGSSGSSGSGSGFGWAQPPSWMTGQRYGQILSDWRFDHNVFNRLPPGVQDAVRAKMAYMYFRGAYNAKYGGDFFGFGIGRGSSSLFDDFRSGSGWGSSSGGSSSGNGYGYGNSNVWNPGGGSSSGSGRSPRAWDQGSSSGGSSSGGSSSGGSSSGGSSSGGSSSGGSNGWGSSGGSSSGGSSSGGSSSGGSSSGGSSSGGSSSGGSNGWGSSGGNGWGSSSGGSSSGGSSSGGSSSGGSSSGGSSSGGSSSGGSSSGGSSSWPR